MIEKIKLPGRELEKVVSDEYSVEGVSYSDFIILKEIDKVAEKLNEIIEYLNKKEEK